MVEFPAHNREVLSSNRSRPTKENRMSWSQDPWMLTLEIVAAVLVAFGVVSVVGNSIALCLMYWDDWRAERRYRAREEKEPRG